MSQTLKLYWDSVPNATSYNIYWKITSGVSIADNVIAGITDVSYHHTGLLTSTRYYYIVVGVDSSGVLGPASVEFSALTGA
jgi:hypothetical protein